MSKLKLEPALWLTLAGLFMLAACQAAPALLATASPIANSSTPTVSSTSTATLTPSPTQLPSPAVPPGFQPIDPERILPLLDLIKKRSDESYAESNNDEFATSAIYLETSAVDRFISADLERFYPNGIPGGSRFAEEIVPNWKELPYYPSDSIKKLLLAGTLQYLNERHIQFSPQQKLSTAVFSIIPAPIKIDADPRSAWLAQIDYTEYNLRALLPLWQGADGSYSLIPNDIKLIELAELSNDLTQLDVTHDLTGDGYVDLALARWHYFGGTVSGVVEVFSWNGTSLVGIGSATLRGVNPRYGETHQSDFTIVDRPGAPAELRVTWPRFRTFGCAWETVTTYRWDGSKLKQSVLDEDAPDKPDCYIIKALDSQGPQEQARWFEAALAQPGSAGTSADLQAWLRLQLAFAYSGQGRDAEAASMLKSMAETSGDAHFLKAARAAYQSAGPAPMAVCKSLRATAAQLAESQSNFDSEIDVDISYGGYPITFEPNPDMICPYEELFKNQLRAKRIAGGLDPKQALAQSGYQFKLLLIRNLDADPALEYIGVLKLERPLIVVLDAVAAGWQIYPLEFSDQPVIGLDLATKPAAGEIGAQMLVMAQTDTAYRRGETSDCLPNTQDYELWLFAAGKEGYSLLQQRGLSCQIQAPLDLQTEQGREKLISLVNACDHCNLSNDYYKPEPDWVKLRGLDDKPLADLDVFDYIEQLDKDVMQSVALSQNRVRIEHLSAYLPADIPAARLLLNHLRYLHALSYELDAQPALALSEYQALIKASPDSLWAQLALVRLKPAS